MIKSATKRYSPAKRDKILKLFHESGYSRSQFCWEMNLGYPSLKRWLENETPELSLIGVVVEKPLPVESVGLNIRLANGIECGFGKNLTGSEAITWIKELKEC